MPAMTKEEERVRGKKESWRKRCGGRKRKFATEVQIVVWSGFWEEYFGGGNFSWVTKSLYCAALVGYGRVVGH